MRRIFRKNISAAWLILIGMPLFAATEGKSADATSKDTVHVVGHAHIWI